MVLHKAMVTHELDRTISFAWLVFSWISFPHPDWRVVIEEDAVCCTEI
jgi:hypothetical protein